MNAQGYTDEWVHSWHLALHLERVRNVLLSPRGLRIVLRFYDTRLRQLRREQRHLKRHILWLRVKRALRFK